jgi:uncharacterized protein YbjQ (UPF0145 family)
VTEPPLAAEDLAGRMAAGLAALRAGPAGSPSPFLSDLSVGDLVLLDEVGLEPVDLVAGAGSASLSPQAAVSPQGCEAWAWALTTAVTAARREVERELAARSASGVVAVQLHLARHPGNVVTCTMLGTAVVERPTTHAAPDRHSERPPAGHHSPRQPAGHRPGHRPVEPFTTALSAADVHLLWRAGYRPVSVVVGAAVAAFGTRSLSQGMGLARENAELADRTAALYQSREQAMERLEVEARTVGADGVVGVRLDEHPVATMLVHVVELLVLGTAVRRTGTDHTPLRPDLQLDLHDPAPQVFEQG